MTPPNESPKLDGLVVLLRYMDAEQFSHFVRQLERMMEAGNGYGEISLHFTDWRYTFITPQPHIKVPKSKPIASVQKVI